MQILMSVLRILVVTMVYVSILWGALVVPAMMASLKLMDHIVKV